MRKILLSAGMILAVFLFVRGSAFSAPFLSFNKELGLFSDVAALAQNTYVEAVPMKQLVRGALQGMMKSLDPYSQYLEPKAYQDLKAETRGEFGGVGLEVSVKGGSLHVISPLDETPAAAAGLHPGDGIVKIDGVSTKELSLQEAVKKLRGAPGSVVTLTILRENQPQFMEFRLERALVRAHGVREAKRLEGGTGYIRIAEFQEKTPADFKVALESLSAQNPKGLILDVRNNPGGVFSAAVDVAECFIPKGSVIVSTRGRAPNKTADHISKNESPSALRPLAVLVNKGSASGSEILAGALQDYGMASVIGQKSYGKGCIQTLTPLPDGSAVRITTSLYYTPKGRLIHESGVTPDILVQESADGSDAALQEALRLFARSSL